MGGGTTPQVAMRRRLLIVHGYSDGSKSFRPLSDFFVARGGYAKTDVRLVDYSSMDDEATFEDFADKLDDDYGRLFEKDEQIDVACHSTGALVVRAWLALRRARSEESGRPRSPVRHLLMFAPANFGSDLARMGQSFLGKFRSTFFNSNAHEGDFMESGKAVLQGLEPASPLQWELSHRDLHAEGFFEANGPEETRCYPFVFAAGNAYTGIEATLLPKRAKPGTDGTVRICGTSLNTRKCVLSLVGEEPAFTWCDETKFDRIPFVVHDGFNHGSIINPDQPGFAGEHGPGTLALRALGVEDPAAYAALAAELDEVTTAQYAAMRAREEREDTRREERRSSAWQQFFFRVRDDVGLPVPDYYLDFHVIDEAKRPHRELTQEFDEKFEAEFTTHSADTACRVMLVNCEELAQFAERVAKARATLVLEVTAASPLPDVSYRRDTFVVFDPQRPDPSGRKFLCPNTTTLVEVVLNRQETSRLLQVCDADSRPIKEPKRPDRPKASGRAQLIEESRGKGSGPA